MKKTETFIVFRNKETGDFLTKYKSKNGALAYSATWSEDLQDAATNNLELLDRYGDKFSKMAEIFGGELLVVNATYELETLDGEEPEYLTENIEEAKRKRLVNLLHGLFSDDDEED
jgi:hypothetical protein